MHVVGFDIAAETHIAAVFDEHGAILRKPMPFAEDRDGYARRLAAIEPVRPVLVVMEATSHNWKNLFDALSAAGHDVALINPLRTRRFQDEELARYRDRCNRRHRPRPLRPAEAAPGHPPRRGRGHGVARTGPPPRPHPPGLRRSAATTASPGRPRIPRVYPLRPQPRQPARDRHPGRISHRPSRRQGDAAAPGQTALDGRHLVGADLAGQLIDAAERSVGVHHAPAYRIQVRDICPNLELWRRRPAEREGDIERLLREHEVGTLLTSVDGIGPQTAGRLITELGNPARFDDAHALAAYVGVVPG